MTRAAIVTDTDGRFYALRIRCPAGHDHMLPVDWTPPGMARAPAIPGRDVWQFNGDLMSPTLTPSICWVSGASSRCVCHSYITAGRIQFLPDCTHGLAGQTVDLLEVDGA